MKRVLVMLMILLLLTGCSRTEPTPVEPEPPPAVEENEPVASTTETESEPVSEAELDPEVRPEPTPQSEPVPEVTPQPTPQPEPVPEPQPEPAPEPAFDWAAYVTEFYNSMTGHSEFNVLVWEENDARTDLVIRKGLNDWNVEHVKACLPSFEWTETSYEEFLADAQTKGRGPELLIWDVEGGMGLSCFRDVDVVTIRDETKMIWLRAVDPQGNGSLYDLMSLVAEDALNYQVWNVTVNGTVSPNEAAGRMAEKIAENYRAIPEWVNWKPESVRAIKAEVYDIYHGTPEEFCFNLGLGVKVTDPMAANAGYWQAGAGLEEPDEEGFYGWRHQVWVQKNDNGEWELKSWGTGGYTVMPQNTENKSQLAWLVEVFCLSEGFAHDWVVPNQILNLDPEELAALPEVLDQLTEAESKDLCQTLGKLLRENDCWILTADDLKPLLGDYGSWLDV